jgi:hypothetical protein
VEAVEEKLGIQAIEGVLAEGLRRSFRSLTVETWDAVDLKVTLVTKSSNGYSSKLINLTRAEPDPSRFRPPAEYRIVNEREPLAMTIRRQ